MDAISLIPLETILSFAVASFLIELTPGPNMVWLAVLSVSSGKRAGFIAVLGVSLGLAIIGIAGALGATALIETSEVAYQALRWAGILFLLYLAWDGWRDTADLETSEIKSGGQHFMRGLLTNILNPKAAAFYVTVLPTFVDRSVSVPVQTGVLTLVYVVVASGVHAGIVALAASLKPLLANPAKERFVRRALSALLALVAVWFAMKTAR